MKITNRQLRRLIREVFKEPHPSRKRLDVRGEPISSMNPEAYRLAQRTIEPDLDSDEQADYDEAEYQRGYQDGLDAYPVADNATPDYDAGYEDGKLDADLPGTDIRDVRSEDW